ncbi:bifunctional transcriptional activator/DNA repair enzyme AdaA [Pontibacillus salicampi]|uniref:Bifunctional transcriptional activator/DNA repair enzyme AdaA n=1 Tax=Pontibacillus salicampi TaxID=1449801 RepID=A0ABV6LIH0_9BACI
MKKVGGELSSVHRDWYEALIKRKKDYEGVFFVGVKTTGIFCRPTCPARKPKFENCEFFETAQGALLASYRPCQRCKPLSHPNQASELVQQLVELVEGNPEKRWRDSDVRALHIDPSTARRQFKKRFGMTFVEYARARRMGLAMKEIRNGKSVIHAQVLTGYESGSGFRDAFSSIMGAPPSVRNPDQLLYASWLDTPIGPMIAIGDDTALYLLEFVDRKGLEKEIEQLRYKTKAAIVPGYANSIQSIEEELKEYFTGTLLGFHTPIHTGGTRFQQEVWNVLQTIPMGETKTYGEVAQCIENPKAVRAVARANGANQLAIIIPCHRVIGADGSLTGYGGGLHRKKWLLHHEQQHFLTTTNCIPDNPLLQTEREG